MLNHRYCPQCASPLESRVAGEALRLACSSKQCDYVFWNNPVPVVAAIVEHEGDIILARNVAWPEKMFALITGFLEKNEAPQVAVAREVKEELNLDAMQVSFVGLYTFERMNQLIIGYHVVAAGEIKLNQELADYRRIKPEKLRPWRAATGLALADWMTSRGLKFEWMDFPARAATIAEK